MWTLIFEQCHSHILPVVFKNICHVCHLVNSKTGRLAPSTSSCVPVMQRVVVFWYWVIWSLHSYETTNNSFVACLFFVICCLLICFKYEVRIWLLCALYWVWYKNWLQLDLIVIYNFTFHLMPASFHTHSAAPSLILCLLPAFLSANNHATGWMKQA